MKLDKILNIVLVLLVGTSIISLLTLLRQNSFISDLVEHEYDLEAGSKGYPFRTTDLEGNLISVPGARTLLIFLSSTCETCTRNLALYQDFHEKFAPTDMQVIGVSAESIGTLRFLKNEHKLTFTLISDRKRTIFWEYKIKVVPTLVLIDREGMIAKIQSPNQSSESFLLEVQKYLEDETFVKH